MGMVKTDTIQAAASRKLATDSEEFRREIVLCGKTVNRSVLGKPVYEPLNLVQREEGETKKFRAAKERRIKLEKCALLEEYQERKLAERIKQLEDMRAFGSGYQGELEKKEARRLARKEELREQLAKDVDRIIEKENHEKEEKKKKKKK